MVQYLDYEKDSFAWDNSLFPVCHKRKSFEHENEVRLIWWLKSLDNFRLVKAEEGVPKRGIFASPGRLVKVDLPRLVQQVYVSPISQGWFRDVVESVTRKYGLDCPVIQSDLYRDPPSGQVADQIIRV